MQIKETKIIQPKIVPKKNKTALVCCSIAGSIFFLAILTFAIIWLVSFLRVFTTQEENLNVSLPNISNLNETTLPETQQSQTYNISENLVLTNIGLENSYLQTVYIAKFHDLAPNQDILEETISPVNYEIIKDENNNEFLKYTFYNLPPNESRNFNFQYKIKLNSVQYDLKNCQGQIINQELSPETYIESDNPEIIAQSQKITKDSANQCQASKDIYNWIDNNISYPQYFPQANGALWALQNKQGDCTEFADLFIAMNRANNIPARFIEGLVYASDEETDASKMKHDWTQVYLPNVGWVPVDPTFGRFPSKRQDYFAALPATHATLTIGQNLEILNNYYFYYYEYNGSTVETTQENWRMQKTE